MLFPSPNQRCQSIREKSEYDPNHGQPSTLLTRLLIKNTSRRRYLQRLSDASTVCHREQSMTSRSKRKQNKSDGEHLHRPFTSGLRQFRTSLKMKRISSSDGEGLCVIGHELSVVPAKHTHVFSSFCLPVLTEKPLPYFNVQSISQPFYPIVYALCSLRIFTVIINFYYILDVVLFYHSYIVVWICLCFCFLSSFFALFLM